MGSSTAKRKGQAPRGKAAKRASARQRVEQMRAAQARRERTRWIITFGITGVIVAVLVSLAAWAIVNENRENDQPAALPRPVQLGSATAGPPWPVPQDPVAGARQVGLAVQPMEGTAKHFHAHVDILVDGEPVQIPANLGIASGGISELHTHDTRGVIHIEAPTADKRYILGQLFNVWQVRLDQNGIGGLRGDANKTLSAYVDGKKWTGDPAAIELKSHQQIALVYGSPEQKVDIPASFKFDPNE